MGEYDAVIAALMVKRQQLDVALAALRELAGDGAPAAPAPRRAKAQPATTHVVRTTAAQVKRNATPTTNGDGNGRGSLSALVVRALHDLGDGAGTAAIAAAVKQLGYETVAKDECWVQMVYQVLAKHDGVRFLGRGKGWAVGGGA